MALLGQLPYEGWLVEDVVRLPFQLALSFVFVAATNWRNTWRLYELSWTAQTQASAQNGTFWKTTSVPRLRWDFFGFDSSEASGPDVWAHGLRWWQRSGCNQKMHDAMRASRVPHANKWKRRGEGFVSSFSRSNPAIRSLHCRLSQGRVRKMVKEEASWCSRAWNTLQDGNRIVPVTKLRRSLLARWLGLTTVTMVRRSCSWSDLEGHGALVAKRRGN